jgi:hypothetical protein
LLRIYLLAAARELLAHHRFFGEFCRGPELVPHESDTLGGRHVDVLYWSPLALKSVGFRVKVFRVYRLGLRDEG